MMYMPKEERRKNKIVSPLPKAPESALRKTIEAIEILEEIYLKETESLNNSDTRGFMVLQDEKLRRAQIYQNHVEQIISRKDEMANVSPELKNKLHMMQERFSKTSQDNLESIQRMQRTVDRLGNTIQRAAKDTAKKSHAVNYSETGQIRDSENRRVSIGLSETV